MCNDAKIPNVFHLKNKNWVCTPFFWECKNSKLSHIIVALKCKIVKMEAFKVNYLIRSALLTNSSSFFIALMARIFITRARIGISVPMP